MPSEAFERALSALLAASGLEPGDGAPTRVTAGDLDITITTGPREIVVDLAGWHQVFTLDEDDDDAALLALDLIGAALFGAARVLVEQVNGRARRCTLQVTQEGAWRTVTSQGAGTWNIFAARTTRIHVGDRPRPPRYAPTSVTPLPWAPWAGQCGFFGAAATTLPAEMPVDGELDLHNFRPREIKPLVLAYIDACLARGLTELRIVHGKGIGNLRRTVHALLERHPRVRGYRLGGHDGGSWGATIVDLSSGTDEPGSA